MFTVKVKNRPTVPNNENYWQVFKDDKHIDDFLQSRNAFAEWTPNSSHEKDYSDEEKAHETDLS